MLLVQCDPLATSLRRIEHAKFICENARSKFVTSRKNAAAGGGGGGGGGGGLSAPEGSPEKVGSGSSGLSAAEPEDGAPGAPPSLGAEVSQDEKNDGGDIPPPGSLGLSRSVSEGEGKEDGKDGFEPSTSTVSEEGGAGGGGSGGGRGVHVILLLHLPRGLDNKFCVSFDMRWRYAFVDSIESNARIGLPDVESMIGKTMEEVVKELNLKKVLMKCFRPSLAKLTYL